MSQSEILIDWVLMKKACGCYYIPKTEGINSPLHRQFCVSIELIPVTNSHGNCPFTKIYALSFQVNSTHIRTTGKLFEINRSWLFVVYL